MLFYLHYQDFFCTFYHLKLPRLKENSEHISNIVPRVKLLRLCAYKLHLTPREPPWASVCCHGLWEQGVNGRVQTWVCTWVRTPLCAADEIRSWPLQGMQSATPETCNIQLWQSWASPVYKDTPQGPVQQARENVEYTNIFKTWPS